MDKDDGSFSVSWAWVLAGKAIFTVNNPDGESYTFQVKKVEDEEGARPPVWFASLLSGPDNESDSSYTYLGVVRPEPSLSSLIAGVPILKLTRASKLDDETLPVKVLRWALKVIWYGHIDKLPPGYGINGAGRCGRCGRMLTRPEGIAPDGYRLGYGPECWSRMQGAKS